MRLGPFHIDFRTSREIALENELRSIQEGQGPTGWGPTYDALFYGGETITRRKALEVPAIFAAVDVVSKTLASLPFEPFRKTDTGSEAAKGHPLYTMETLEPSPYVTAFNFRRDMFADGCFGNAAAKITFKGNGRASMLERMPPDEYTPYRAEDGRMYYIWTHHINGKLTTEILFEYEVLHLRGMTIDGLEGLDIPNLFKDSIGMSRSTTQYGGRFFRNNAAVDGAIEFPGGLTPQNREIYERKIREKHAGVENTGGIILLDAGAKYNKIGTNPQEAMLNETRTFQAYENCRIFGVPAHMIHVLDRSTFNNIEMMDNGFVKYCLAPWAQNFEQECDVKLLTSAEKTSGSIFHRFDLSGLMRGDMKSQGEFYDRMLKNMVLSINDVRAYMNLNAVPWGNLPYAQAGVTPVNEDGSIDINTPADNGANQQNDGTTVLDTPGSASQSN